MLDLFPVELREPVWYILAGFILGFAVSTVWEWLYFRRFRIDSLDESQVESSTRFTQRSETFSQPVAGFPDFESATQNTAYRSPAIFLESERPSSVSPSSASLPSTSLSTAPLTTAPLLSSVPPMPVQTQTVAQPVIDPDLVIDPAQESEPEMLLPVWVPSEPKSKRTQSWQERKRAGQAEKGDAPTVSASIQQDAKPSHDSSQVPSQALSQVSPQVPSLHMMTNTATLDTPTTIAKEPIVESSSLVEKAEAAIDSALEVAATVTLPMLPELSTSTGSPRVPRSRGYPDDLALIKGIGDIYKRRLYEAKIFTFHHVAMSDIDVLRRATQAAPNANVEVWPLRAQELAQKYGRTNASYSGPLPEDLTKIPGIGPYFAQTLYRTGICTYAQLADASVEELATLFPTSVLGREINFQDWLDTAAVKVLEHTTRAKP